MSLIWWLWRATNLYAILLVAMVGTHLEVLQAVNGQAPAPSPAATFPYCWATFPNCQGVVITYNVSYVGILYPYLSAGSPLQPYSFGAGVWIKNEGYKTLSDWEMGIQFNHSEILVSASNAVLADGTSFPAPVGNGAILTGYPARNISTVISTAGDLSQSQVLVNLQGTEVGSDGKTSYPFPLSINLTNSGYTCSNPSSYTVSSIRVCCAENATLSSNSCERGQWVLIPVLGTLINVLYLFIVGGF
jgi:hypothetical protein